MNDERDSSGKFLPGNKAAATKKNYEEYQEIFKARITPDDFAELVETTKRMAKARNIKAIELLFKYILGLPVQRTELTGDNGGAINIVGLLDSIGRVYGNNNNND